MVTFLRQVTTGTITRREGPFIDINGAALTGLTISQADVRLSKNGGDYAQKNDATAATHDEGGWYIVTYNATDLGTLGTLEISIQETGALPYFKSYMIVNQQVWDSLFGADLLQVHANEITAGLITAAAVATGAIDADAIASDAITAAKIAADAITSTKIATGAITAAKFAAGAIDASAIATDALTAAKIATDAIAEIQAGLSVFNATADTVLLDLDTQTQINVIETNLLQHVMGFATFGTINDATPSATEFVVSTDFVNADDHYVSADSPQRVYVLSGAQKGRRATITDQVGLTITVGPGFSAAPANGSIIAIMP